jgi:3-methyladenine DNA glycosylase AlkD
MQAAAVLSELEAMGSEKTKAMLMRNHGVKEPCFGVKIGDMKRLVKRIKCDHALALALYDSGNYDAMYFAGLIADDARMTRRDLQRWAQNARGGCLAGSTVAWVAAGSAHGWDLALKWIDAPKAHVAEAGWATLSCRVALREDADLDLRALETLVDRVRETIHTAPDALRYAMNNFVISVGCYVRPLTALALEAGAAIGPVAADLGNNQCRIPSIIDYIRKVEKRGSLGRKRKAVKC